ncbi:Jasmonate-zim-domain protein 6, putative isoform 2 [Hibiscus syriacus]|uniref:Jasmonate-zim-domain protein 6, putative isoform 2 n=1 Tax=Hibiscus syriacus TaxID=106335 RepID=A0A6A2ZYC7_HIBSY|nr:Jasmonate-zim-domain protein 6, putative isoform 2 [Hibiscus syriacus]
MLSYEITFSSEVGASTIDREFPAVVVLGNGTIFGGVSLYSGEPLVDDSKLPLETVLPYGNEACRWFRDDTDKHGRERWVKLLVAAFSSRGPHHLKPEILKPAVIAPGVSILAGWTGAAAPTDLDMDPRRIDYNIISVTSMACPHITQETPLMMSKFPSPGDLNYQSFSVVFHSSDHVVKYQRSTVNQTLSHKIVFASDGLYLSGIASVGFGSIEWSEGVHPVRSHIAVSFMIWRNKLEHNVITFSLYLASMKKNPMYQGMGKKHIMSNFGQKSSFVNLLSQYLKEKRNIGDFSIGISSKSDAKGKQAKTMNLLSSMADFSESSRPNLVASNVKSAYFFPDRFGASASIEDNINSTVLRGNKECSVDHILQWPSGCIQRFPAGEGEGNHGLTNQGSSTTCTGGNASDSITEKSSSNVEKIDIDIPDLIIASATANTPAHDPTVERRQYGGSDLRIARRNSLHKFFAKRKDRAAARAPYQLNNNRVLPPPSKPDANKPSCEEGRSSRNTPRCIDLNL